MHPTHSHPSRGVIVLEHCTSIAILIGVYECGALLSQWIPLPATINGVFILLGLFVVLGQVPGFIRRTIPQYLSHMSLFFVPAIMAVWLFQDDVITHWLSLLLALVGTTILSMVVVMWLSHRLLKSS